MKLLDYATTKELIGQKVTDSLGNNYGTIRDILFSPGHRKAVLAIISSGGSTDTIVLPFQALRVNPNTRHVTAELNKETVEHAPEVDMNRLHDGDREELIKIYNYYGYENIWKEESQEGQPLHQNYRSGEDVGDHNPAAEGSYEITKQYPGPKGSHTEDEVDFDKMKGLPKDKK
ncbi:PRC-barrel domain-containing protein [Nafulsella turpanensis]|uniref:PRC-barrel domain-containing protein n=1 Tax=Nafulsella turpanensis TaxID=1265690 RepID=UPI000347074C|nr:PRC-barrel domain-containing protein [Nafulsella turpanensis]